MSGVNSGRLTGASGTAAAIGTIGNTAGKAVVFKVTAGGAETVSVTGSIVGSVVSSKIMCYSLLTGVLHSTVDMASGTYFIPQITTGNLIFLGSAATEVKTVDFLLSDAN